MARHETLKTIDPLGLNAWSGEAKVMPSFHRHDDIEVNFVHRGSVTYMFGARKVKLRPGRLVVFWAALPHLMMDVAPRTRMSWLTLPAAWLLQWRLAPTFVNGLLNGMAMSQQRNDRLDSRRMAQWEKDLAAGNEETRRIATLEIEARLRRMAISKPMRLKQIITGYKRHRADDPQIGKVERMAGFIARYYVDDIHVSHIAANVNLNQNYAMTLFKQVCGMSLKDYVLRHRISHSQRLLAITDRPILNVALDSGFGCLSSFYEAFAKTCGCTPRTYRKRMNPGG